MPFKEIPGLPGKLYVPEQNPDAPKKHRCPDCFACQMCSDVRCRVCRDNHGKAGAGRPGKPCDDNC